MKQPAAICDAVLLVGNDVAMANATMQHAMPVPLTMKTARRPNRSMAMNARNDDKNFHVSAPADSTRETSLLRPRFSWKRMVAYTLMRLLPLLSLLVSGHVSVVQDRYLRHLLVKLQEEAKAEPVRQLVLAHLKEVAQLSAVSARDLEGELDAGHLGVDLVGVLR